MTSDLELLQLYANWTAAIWSGSARLDTRDFAVMSLGAAGECGEVAEVLETPPVSPAALCKELGDVLYYWARLCEALALPVAEVWPASSHALPRASALSLCVAGARVAEAMKKVIRKDARGAAPAEAAARERVRQALSQLACAWLSVALENGLSVAEVAAANRSKLEDRQARNVLRGSGDER